VQAQKHFQKVLEMEAPEDLRRLAGHCSICHCRASYKALQILPAYTETNISVKFGVTEGESMIRRGL
jgi:hypothetical protein